MTSFADRLVARATDRVSAVQPVINPLFASWPRDAGMAGGPLAQEALFETEAVDETRVGRTVPSRDTKSAVGTPHPQGGTPGTRRQTLDEWLTANAPAALTTDRTRARRVDHRALERGDADTLSIAEAADDNRHGATGASDGGSRRTDDARENSARDARQSSAPRGPNDALTEGQRHVLHVASEPLRASKEGAPESPNAHPHRGELSNARVARQATASNDVAPPVQVTIGRVVVRAVLPNAPQAVPPSAPAPPVGSTLAEYLARGRRP